MHHLAGPSTIYLGKKVTFIMDYVRAVPGEAAAVSHAVLQNDGKYVVAITINRNSTIDFITSTSGAGYFTKLFRLNADLSLDRTFGNQGFLELTGHTIQLQINADKAYLFTNTADAQVMSKFTLGDNTVYKINLGTEAMAVNDMAYNNSASVYPNPTTGLVKILSNLPDHTTAQIYSSIGINLATLPLVNSTMDLTTFKKGIYMVKISNQSYKIIRE